MKKTPYNYFKNKAEETKKQNDAKAKKLQAKPEPKVIEPIAIKPELNYWNLMFSDETFSVQPLYAPAPVKELNLEELCNLVSVLNSYDSVKFKKMPITANGYMMVASIENKKCSSLAFGVSTLIETQYDVSKDATIFTKKFIIDYVVQQVRIIATSEFIAYLKDDKIYKYIFEEMAAEAEKSFGVPRAFVNYVLNAQRKGELKMVDGAVNSGSWLVKAPVVNKIAYDALKLPGMNAKVECPVNDNELTRIDKNGNYIVGSYEATLYKMVQHLNDYHKWSRDKIADWLDQMHDDGKINIEFSPWEDNNDSED